MDLVEKEDKNDNCFYDTNSMLGSDTDGFQDDIYDTVQSVDQLPYSVTKFGSLPDVEDDVNIELVNAKNQTTFNESNTMDDGWEKKHLDFAHQVSREQSTEMIDGVKNSKEVIEVVRSPISVVNNQLKKKKNKVLNGEKNKNNNKNLNWKKENSKEQILKRKEFHQKRLELSQKKGTYIKIAKSTQNKNNNSMSHQENEIPRILNVHQEIFENNSKLSSSGNWKVYEFTNSKFHMKTENNDNEGEMMLKNEKENEINDLSPKILLENDIFLIPYSHVRDLLVNCPLDILVKFLHKRHYEIILNNPNLRIGIDRNKINLFHRYSSMLLVEHLLRRSQSKIDGIIMNISRESFSESAEILMTTLSPNMLMVEAYDAIICMQNSISYGLRQLLELFAYSKITTLENICQGFCPDSNYNQTDHIKFGEFIQFVHHKRYLYDTAQMPLDFIQQTVFSLPKFTEPSPPLRRNVEEGNRSESLMDIMKFQLGIGEKREEFADLSQSMIDDEAIIISESSSIIQPVQSSSSSSSYKERITQNTDLLNLLRGKPSVESSTSINQDVTSYNEKNQKNFTRRLQTVDDLMKRTGITSVNNSNISISLSAFQMNSGKTINKHNNDRYRDLMTYRNKLTLMHQTINHMQQLTYYQSLSGRLTNLIKNQRRLAAKSNETIDEKIINEIMRILPGYIPHNEMDMLKRINQDYYYFKLKESRSDRQIIQNHESTGRYSMNLVRQLMLENENKSNHPSTSSSSSNNSLVNSSNNLEEDEKNYMENDDMVNCNQLLTNTTFLDDVEKKTESQSTRPVHDECKVLGPLGRHRHALLHLISAARETKETKKRSLRGLFENALGRVSFLDMNHPKQIIDMTSTINENSNDLSEINTVKEESTQDLVKSSYKFLLLAIENLFSRILKIDEIDTIIQIKYHSLRQLMNMRKFNDKHLSFLNQLYDCHTNMMREKEETANTYQIWNKNRKSFIEIRQIRSKESDEFFSLLCRRALFSYILTVKKGRALICQALQMADNRKYIERLMTLMTRHILYMLIYDTEHQQVPQLIIKPAFNLPDGYPSTVNDVESLSSVSYLASRKKDHGNRTFFLQSDFLDNFPIIFSSLFRLTLYCGNVQPSKSIITKNIHQHFHLTRLAYHFNVTVHETMQMVANDDLKLNCDEKLNSEISKFLVYLNIQNQSKSVDIHLARFPPMFKLLDEQRKKRIIQTTYQKMSKLLSNHVFCCWYLRTFVRFNLRIIKKLSEDFEKHQTEDLSQDMLRIRKTWATDSRSWSYITWKNFINHIYSILSHSCKPNISNESKCNSCIIHREIVADDPSNNDDEKPLTLNKWIHHNIGENVSSLLCYSNMLASSDLNNYESEPLNSELTELSDSLADGMLHVYFNDDESNDDNKSEERDTVVKDIRSMMKLKKVYSRFVDHDWAKKYENILSDLLDEKKMEFIKSYFDDDLRELYEKNEQFRTLTHHF
ncbi:hypothetical protein SNEBB_004683 [Seison nebaliae]|nr:hypothetical protein SNEBB_004683 [Seison nebaliae]